MGRNGDARAEVPLAYPQHIFQDNRGPDRAVPDVARDAGVPARKPPPAVAVHDRGERTNEEMRI